MIKSAFTGAPNQEWMIVKASDAEDEYMIMDVNSGKFLSICASSPDDNATVWIWHNDGTSGQRFHIYNTGGGIYKLLTKTSNYTKAVGVDSSTGYGKQLPMSSAYTILYLEQASYTVGLNDGKTFLQNGASQHFLYGKIDLFGYDYATQDSFSGQIPTCNFNYIGNNYYTISTVDDKYLTLFNDSPEEGDKIRLYNYTASDDKQIWKLVITSAGAYQFQPKLDTSGTLILCSQDEIDGSQLVLKNKNNVSGDYGSWYHFTTDENFSTLGAHIVALEDDSHDTSHFKWMPKALFHLYNKSSIYTRSKIFVSESEMYDRTIFLEEMEKSNLFIFRGHGDFEYDAEGELDTWLLLNPRNSSGNPIGDTQSVSAWLLKCDIEEYVEDDTSDETEDSGLYNISGLRCATFASCHSAQEAYSAAENGVLVDNNSMVSVFSYGGTDVAIGFDGEVSCDYADLFLRKLFENYLIENSWIRAFTKTIQNTSVGNNLPYLLTDTYGIYYNNGTQYIYGD